MTTPEEGPEERYTPPVNDDGTPLRPPTRMPLVALTIGIALAVVVGAITVLGLVVPREYNEQSVLSLNATDLWRYETCLSLPEGSNGVIVTFSWESSDNATVQLEGWNGAANPFYNVTARAGSGSYTLDADGGFAFFQAFGEPNLPQYVNITLDYHVPGHYLGGPDVPPAC